MTALLTSTDFYGLISPKILIGVTTEIALTRFLTAMPARFESATGPGRLNGVIVTADHASGRATAIQRLNLSAAEIEALAAAAPAPASR
jgi:calcineurin-like phosphoesterase